jgi:uncharacterized protein (TIGR03083 family)
MRLAGMEMSARDWFDTAADGLLAVADVVRNDDLQRPGLGEWDVRSLLGHTSRSFLTIEGYLATEPGDVGHLADAAAYYRAASTATAHADPSAITERGRAAGRDLGDRPAAQVRAIADRVRALVRSTPDDVPVATPFGTMTLLGYLPTRAFELTVHGIDLARAIDQDVPPALVDASAPATALCGAIASGEARVAALMALTGRTDLPPGFSVV